MDKLTRPVPRIQQLETQARAHAASLEDALEQTRATLAESRAILATTDALLQRAQGGTTAPIVHAHPQGHREWIVRAGDAPDVILRPRQRALDHGRTLAQNLATSLRGQVVFRIWNQQGKFKDEVFDPEMPLDERPRNAGEHAA